MADSTIGIKIADGSYYPVLGPGYTGKKKLTLTTVKDKQEKVQINLYQGEGAALAGAQYIGSLIIENIVAAPRGTPDIELILGVDGNGELNAQASDRSTGESQSFSIGLRALSEEETYEVPEFEMESEAATVFPTPIQSVKVEAAPTSQAPRQQVQPERRPPSRAAVALFVAAGIIIIALVVWLLIRTLGGSSKPAAAVTPPRPAATAVTQPQQTQQPASAAQAQTTATAPATPQATTAPKGGVTYRIKRGDTLWDISATYYRNPWLYPKLASANKIKNPDLIFAGAKLYIPEE